MRSKKGDEHHDGDEAGEDARSDAEQDRDTTHKLYERSGVRKKGCGWKAKSRHRTREPFHSAIKLLPSRRDKDKRHRHSQNK